MVVAVTVGVLLAALLFMRRTAELTHSKMFDAETTEANYDLPPGVALYEIAGPLFFGAAQSAMGALETVGASVSVVVLALSRVPSIDATGLVALESALGRLRNAKKRVVIAGPLPDRRRRVFEKANYPNTMSTFISPKTPSPASTSQRVWQMEPSARRKPQRPPPQHRPARVPASPFLRRFNREAKHR